MSEHKAAPAPSRGSSNQVIQFGLISIPVQVFTGTEDGASVPRKQFTADGHAVGSKSYDKETGEDVASGDIVKMAQASNGEFVALSDEEIETATSGGPVKGLAEIITRAPASSLGREYTVLKTDQVRAGKRTVGTKKVDDPAAQKALALLLDTLAANDEVVIVRVATKYGAKNAAITSDGRWLTLAYAQQVRGDVARPEVTITPAELALGQQLLATIPVGTPVLADEGGVKVQAFVDAKAQTGEAPAAPEVFEPAAITDLTALLEASLAA